MTEQTSDMLRRALRANKWTAGLSGVAVLLAAGPIAEWTGLASELGEHLAVLLVLGVGLAMVVFSGLLSGVSRPATIDRREAVAAWGLNLGWLAVGLALLVSPLSITVVGVGLLALLSVVAAVFAGLEAYAIWARAGTIS